MKDKKKIIVILICILVLITILFSLKLFIFTNKKIIINNISINYDKQIGVCIDNNNCELLSSDNYPIISIKTNSSKLKKIVNNYNKDINKLYDKVINSNLDSNECNDFKDNYKYRYTTNVYYYIYHDDKVVSISRELYVKDLCTNNYLNKEFNSNVYDISTGQLLDNNDILSKYNYDEEYILDNIKNDIDNRNSISTSVIIIDDVTDYKLYFDNDGKIMIHYIDNKTNNSYNAVLY